MPNKRMNDYSNIISYVLNTYSDYIDNLQIIELNNLLSKDAHHYDVHTIRKVINSIMQLIVDECGSDIVNDLNLPSQYFWGYYKDVTFNDHVDIRKDSIEIDEFLLAKFNNGVTIHSKKLPQGALSTAYMNGVVDLTNVVELDGFNLNYINDDYTIVRLSKDLKKIDRFAFANKLSNITIEYPGTIHEFNSMIFENFLQWPERYKNQFNDVLEDTNTLKIKCLDGYWDREVFKHDQRYHEWDKKWAN